MISTRVLSIVGCIGIGWFSTSSSAFEEVEIETDLPAFEALNFKVGTRYQLQKVGGDGSVSEWIVASIVNNIATLRNGKCEIDISIDMPFAPDLAWRDCSFGTGSNTITYKKGQVFPIEVGTKFQYSFRGKNDTGSTSVAIESAVRKCKVKKKARVSVPMGEFDTFKLVCSDKRQSRTWWLVPELGFWVAYKKIYKRGETSIYEYLSVTSP